jgi:hypothetical protein
MVNVERRRLPPPDRAPRAKWGHRARHNTRANPNRRAATQATRGTTYPGRVQQRAVRHPVDGDDGAVLPSAARSSSFPARHLPRIHLENMLALTRMGA